MAPRRLGLMKKVCIFAFVIIPLYTVFYITYFQKANLLLKNGLNYDETKGLQYNLEQDNTQEVLRGREDTKRSSSDNAKQDSPFSHFEKTQSNSKVHFKINDSRSSKTEIPIKETAISKNILPTSVTTKELARRQVKEQLVTSITLTQATKVKLASNKQWMIWNEDSSSSNLNRRLQTVKNNYVAMNKYAVNFTGSRRSRKLSSKELLCELKQRVEVASIQLGDEPFTTFKWQEYLPNRNFSQVLGHFRTCAVVASAGSILQSNLGSEIDAHDAVLRFNGAPTTGFESDVGSRTTIRIVNSQRDCAIQGEPKLTKVPNPRSYGEPHVSAEVFKQIVSRKGNPEVLSRPEHKFHVNSLYKTGVLLVWDPAPYSGNLTEWFKHPDYDFFENYIKYREKNPNQPFYIINPKMQWQLWNIIQENTAEDIQRNPPSSGLMGILLMMTICDQIDVYEFLPSRRRTDLCHYYERFQDQACTMGAYHPLMFEKNLVKRINRGSDREIYIQGKATLPGFGTFQCPNPE